jgi:hypothetical protein
LAHQLTSASLRKRPKPALQRNDAKGQQETSRLFDDIISKREQCRRNVKAEGPGGFKIDYKFEPSRLFDWQISWLGTL